MRQARSWTLLLAGSLAFDGCASASKSKTAPPAGDRPPPAVTGTIAATPKRAPPKPVTPYTGHGSESSVSPEVIAKFRAPPLPPEISRRVQAMLDVRSPSIGRVSPDGKALFFPWAITGVTQLWKVDGPLHFPLQLTGGEDATFMPSMTPDGAFLIVQRDRNGEENPGLYLQDPNGGPLIEIQHKPGVQTFFQAVTDDSRALYYRSNERKKDSYVIAKVDLKTRNKEVIFDQDGLWYVADHRPDGRLLLIKETGSVAREVYEWDSSKRALTPLLGQNESEEYDVAYGPGDKEVIVRTNKLGEFRRIYSFIDGKLTPITADIKFDVARFSIDRTRARIVYEINEDGLTRLKAMDAKTHQPIALPNLPQADHIVLGATTPNARFTTIGIDDGRHPLQAYVLDWRTKKLEKWHMPSAPEIDTTQFVRASVEHYPARDGTQIPILVRRPKKCAPEPCPVIVSFHGGPEGQAVPGFATIPQLFVEAGFVFAEPNVRGSDGYGKAWFHADDGPKRLQIITDIEDAAKWARTTFASNGKEPKVGIYGGSYGGYSVLIGMSMFAGAYDVGVDIVGISNLISFLKNTAPYRRLLRITEYGDPEKDKEALEKLSPMTYLDRMRAPLLIVQGAMDPRVPVGESIQIHEAVAKKGIPTDLIIFPDEGHGAQKRVNRVLQFGHALAFFQKHLLGKSTPSQPADPRRADASAAH